MDRLLADRAARGSGRLPRAARVRTSVGDSAARDLLPIDNPVCRHVHLASVLSPLMITLEDPQPVRRRVIGWVLFATVAIGAVVTTWITLSHLSTHPRTNDANIAAEVARIASGLPGQIVAVHVKNDQSVRADDLLFELDATTYRLLRDQAAAQVAAARATLKDAEGVVQAEMTNAESARAEIDRASSNLALTQATVARLEPLVDQGLASQQALDEARALSADASVSLRVAEQTAAAATSLVKTTDAFQAELKAAEAALAIAEHTLARTSIRAPFDGKIAGLNVVAGSWVVPDLTVMSLIDDHSWYAEAFFPETDLAAISVGSPARVWIMSHPDRPLEGRVTSIGWGVQSTDALDLGGRLPFVAQTTDWVRLAKRYPVRITFNSEHADILRVGASATVALTAP